jgi:hypothetical protein
MMGVLSVRAVRRIATLQGPVQARREGCFEESLSAATMSSSGVTHSMSHGGVSPMQSLRRSNRQNRDKWGSTPPVIVTVAPPASRGLRTAGVDPSAEEAGSRPTSSASVAALADHAGASPAQTSPGFTPTNRSRPPSRLQAVHMRPLTAPDDALDALQRTVAGYTPPVSHKRIPKEFKDHAKFLLSEEGADQFRELKQDKIFQAAASRCGVVLRDLRHRPFESFRETVADSDATIAARARQHGVAIMTSLATVLVTMHSAEDAVKRDVSKQASKIKSLRQSLQRVTHHERKQQERMVARQKRLMEVIERENMRVREKRLKLEQARAEMEQRMERAEEARKKEWEEQCKARQAKADKALAAQERRKEMVEQRKRDMLERVLAEREAMEAAQREAERVRQERINSKMSQESRLLQDEARERVKQQREENAASRRKQLEERFERHEQVMSEVMHARALRQQRDNEQRLAAMTQAARVRKAEESKREQLVERIQLDHEMAQKKLEMRDTLRRETQELQKKMRIERDRWMETVAREARELPAPGAYDDTLEFVSEQSPAFSLGRSKRVTVIEEAFNTGKELPGPPMQRPLDHVPQGGRISGAKATSFISEAAELASLQPSALDYQHVDLEQPSLSSSSPGVYSYELPRMFDMQQSRELKSQPSTPCVLPPSSPVPLLRSGSSRRLLSGVLEQETSLRRQATAPTKSLSATLFQSLREQGSRPTTVQGHSSLSPTDLIGARVVTSAQELDAILDEE